MDFQLVANALNQIQQTQGSLAKESLLKEYGETVDGFKDVLKYIYDPYFTTGLKQAKLDNAKPYFCGMQAEMLMEWLKQNNTGTDYAAGIALGFIIADSDPIWQWAAEALVTKNLQIGIAVTTLNKVFGKGFIPKVGIMRGMHAPLDFEGIYIATEKIDGNRRIIKNFESGAEVYTRSGKRDYGLVDVEADFRQLPKGFVYDTELAAMGDYEDSIALRQATASIANRRNQRRSGVRALIFDVLPIEEYDVGISKFGALGRKALLAGIFNDRSSIVKLHAYYMSHDMYSRANSVNAITGMFRSHIEVDTLKHATLLPILGIIENYEQAIACAKPIWETGGEGIMLVEHNSPYEVNPNPRKTLLKIKQTKEYKLPVIGYFEGKNKYTNMLGGIIVKYKGESVGVGSGFTDWERQYYWYNPNRIVDHMVEIESFGESQNQNGGISLNCPIFKRIVGAKE